MTMPDVRVYIGFTGPTVGSVFTVGHPTLGQVGVVQLGDPDTWVDVTQWVVSWSIRRGATSGDSPTLRYDAGTCTVVLNDGDRRFDPENLDGPYVVAGRTQVEPMRRVKIVATWDGTTYPLFYGLSDDFQPDYLGRFWTRTTLTATDATKVFAGTDRSAGSTVGAGDASGTRIGRILDASGWPAADRVIATGDTSLQSTNLAGNMLGEMLLVQDTEGGELYIDTVGRVVFRNRRAMLTATRSTTSQATFGDDPAGYVISSELPYAQDTLVTSDAAMVNSVSASRAGGTEQVAEDAVSVARYLRRTHTRDDLLMQTDAEALNWAQAIVYAYSGPGRRFARLEFNRPRPDVEDVLWPAILGREFGDRITVLSRPAGGGDPIEKDCFVRGLELGSDGHAFDAAFVLQDADRYAFFVVGDPILGRVGMNAVAY